MRNLTNACIVFAIVAAWALTPGCSSSTSDPVRDAGGQGDAAGSSDGGADGGTCIGSDQTYSDTQKGCSSAFVVATCNKGTWRPSQFCEGTNCSCSNGACQGDGCK
jgi:hypothetical protein